MLLEELSLGGPPRPYAELRLLAYDHAAERWNLAVVDSEHGNVVTMNGRMIDGGLEFTSAQNRRGRVVMDRVTLRRGGGGVEWIVTTSGDAGATWRTIVRTGYSR